MSFYFLCEDGVELVEVFELYPGEYWGPIDCGCEVDIGEECSEAWAAFVWYVCVSVRFSLKISLYI